MPDETNDQPYEDTLFLHEERLSVAKVRRVTARVAVQTRTETLSHSLPVALSGEEVEVTRIPMNRPLDAVPDVVTEDGLTIIPIVEERLVVTRQLFLREEVHIRRIARQETVTLPVTTRRQTAHVTRVPADAEAVPRDTLTPITPMPMQRTIPMTYTSDIPASEGTTAISGLFDSRADAQRAVDHLIEAGIPAENVRLVEGASTSDAPQAREGGKGFWETLGDFFFPDEDRYTYAEGLSRGGYLVTVSDLTSSEYEAALNILDDEGTVDLEEREESWRAEGWGGYEASPYAAASPAAAGAAAAVTGVAARPTPADMPASRAGTDFIDEETTPAPRAASFADDTGAESIEVVQERLRVGKRDTSHGRVRVRTYTVEEPVSESIDLREDRVEIERRAVDRPVSGDEALFQDRTVEAEEYREEAVVSKEARVVEEIALRKTSDTRRETVSDTVRHTEVEIEDDRDDARRTSDLNRT